MGFFVRLQVAGGTKPSNGQGGSIVGVVGLGGAGVPTVGASLGPCERPNPNSLLNGIASGDFISVSPPIICLVFA